MNKISFRYLLILICIGLSFSPLTAQSVIYAEDFATGIPAGWSTADLSGTTAKWKYCSQPGSTSSSCPKIWEIPPNSQGPFASTSANNGFMHFDSDAFTMATGLAHNAHLTSSNFDFSNQSQVWLKLEYQIGVYMNPTNSRAVVEVSTDGTSWTLFNFINILPGNTPNPGIIRWSKNPTVGIIDISAIAAGAATTQIRWRWDSMNEYFYAIDDIAFYDADPTSLFVAPIDLAMSNFYAISPNFITPSSQMESFSFLGDFANDGFQSATDLVFKASLNNLSETLYEDSVSFSSISGDTLVENVLFPTPGPVLTETGTYGGRYEINSQSEEENYLNNSKEFQFRISDTLFSKAPSIEDYILPSNISWGDNTPHSWAWGNYYYMPNGQGELATGISFSVSPANGQPMSELSGLTLNAFLYKWEDLNGNAVVEFTERSLVGFADYEMVGLENPFQFIYVPLAQEVALENETAYIAMLSFTATATVPDLRMGAFGNLDYGGMILASSQTEKPRYASILFVNSGGNLDFSTVGFNYSITSSVRLHLKKKDVNVVGATESATMEIFPNPNQGSFWLSSSLPRSSPRTIRVYDVYGKLRHQQTLGSCDKCLLELSQLAAGSYYLRISNAFGQSTRALQLY